MDPAESSNPIAAISKAEIVKRSLDFLYVPLVFYVTERLKALHSETEVAAMLLNRHGRNADVSQLLEICFRHKKDFTEFLPVSNEASITRQVRNCWAHSEPIDDLAITKFLLSCEAIAAAVCTQDSFVAYEHLKALRQCWTLLQAERLLQEFTVYDEAGNSMLSYPVLLPAWTE